MRRFLLTLILSTPFGSLLEAQCTTSWQAGASVPGVDGDVEAMIRWDPDGAGPATPLLVLAGSFRIAGNLPVNNIATYDAATGVWGNLGAGVDGGVKSLAVLQSGELVAGGFFQSTGGVAVSGVVRWTGSGWAPLGAGLLGGGASALATAANGDLYAGGFFLGAGAVQATNIARWDGSNWSAVGGGLDGWVHSLAAMPNGDVIAGGGFRMAGPTAVAGLARWNGSTWAPIGTGLSSAGFFVEVNTVTVMANGDLVVGGSFQGAGSVVANGLARWNGSSWSGFLMGPNTAARCVAELPNGDLVIGGTLDLPGLFGSWSLALWNASQGWSPLLDTSVVVLTLLALPSGGVLVGGQFESIGGIVASSLGVYNSGFWTSLATGSPATSHRATVITSKVLANGDVVVGGSFAMIEGVAARNVARRNGSNWSPLGLGVDGGVGAIEELPNGDLVAGGAFGMASGMPSYAARWDGTAWSPMPGIGNLSPLGSVGVAALATLPNGDLVAGGAIPFASGLPAGNLATWNGTSWVPFTGLADNYVRALVVLPNGDLIVGGDFSTVAGQPANYIARWDGSAWSSLGAGVSYPVTSLAVLPNGDLVAGGFASGSDQIARWDGSSWTPFGSGLNPGVFTMLVLPDGDLLAGGSFTQAGGVPARHIARWDGSSWSAVDSGCNDFVYTLALLPDGDVLAGGQFTLAGGQVSAKLARLRASCPATAIAVGSGCVGSAGPVQLQAITLPWIDSTFRSVATGMPGNSIGIEVRGLSTAALPLPSLLPQGVAGCSLQVSPDLLSLVVPSLGVASSAFVIPNSLSLISAVVYQQVAPVEFGASGSITAVTSSNTLRLVIGVF